MAFIYRLLPFVPGLALAGLGLVVVIMGRSYTVGNLTAMGPGFLPVALGLVLLLLAVILVLSQGAVSSFGAGDTAEQLTAADTVPLLPLLLASSSLLIWALVVDVAGFVPAALVQLVLASCASRHDNWRGVGVSILLITALSYGLFVKLLGLPISAFGQ